jgi:hypothetical protein
MNSRVARLCLTRGHHRSPVRWSITAICSHEQPSTLSKPILALYLVSELRGNSAGKVDEANEMACLRPARYEILAESDMDPYRMCSPLIIKFTIFKWF